MILIRSALNPLLRSFQNLNNTLFKSGVAVSCACRFVDRNTSCSFNRTLAIRRKDFNVYSVSKETEFLPKWRLLSEMNFESIEDAKPFANLPMSTLLHIHRVTSNDVKNRFCKNRLYYIADHIKCPAAVLSGLLAKRTFIYSLSFDWLASSLKTLLEMGVSGDRIMRDLWVLKYHKDTIRERLQRVKGMGVDKLYPWMVRCSEHILNRYICIYKETKDILGDLKTTKVYLADRLNINLEEVNEICSKLPALNTIRVTKVKSFLDFLEKEGFSAEEIANKPRILTSSQKTVQERLEKLRALGFTTINLNVLCRSRKHFTRYVESIEAGSCGAKCYE